MIKKVARNEARQARHSRVRAKVSGTANVPRLNVFRSNKAIYAQVIDDVAGTTLVSSSTLELKIKNGGNIEAAKAVGKDVAEKCKKAKINNFSVLGSVPQKVTSVWSCATSS